jgi:hypothetical protein
MVSVWQLVAHEAAQLRGDVNELEDIVRTWIGGPKGKGLRVAFAGGVIALMGAGLQAAVTIWT